MSTEIVIFIDEKDNHAITVQEGDITNDDPRSFISSLKDFFSNWMITVGDIELIPNDIDDGHPLIKMGISQLKQRGLDKDSTVEFIVTSLIEVYNEY